MPTERTGRRGAIGLLMLLVAACQNSAVSHGVPEHMCETLEDDGQWYLQPAPVFIWNQRDVARLAGRGQFDGSIVVCGTGGTGRVELPGITAVTGEVWLTDFEGIPVTLAMPDLVEADGVLSYGVSRLDLPRLEYLDIWLAIRDGGPVGELTFPSLRRGTVLVQDTVNVTGLSLPQQRTSDLVDVVRTTGLRSVSIPRLWQIRTLEVAHNADLEVLDIPLTCDLDEVRFRDNPKLPRCRAEQLWEQSDKTTSMGAAIQGEMADGACE